MEQANPTLRANISQADSGSRLALPSLLAVTFFFSFFFRLHAFPLFDLDEGAFSEATREMLASGDYITTYLNGNLRFDKPILTYWLQALSASLLGINEFAFRLPSALASVGWMWAICRFTTLQTDRITGFTAAFIGATSLGISVIGRGAIADALLNFILVMTLFNVYRYMEASDQRFCRRAYFWMGLGLLTKGPVAILIPFVVGGCLFTLYGKWRSWMRAVFNPFGWLILLAVATPWYLLEYRAQGQNFIDGFIMRHNVERFQGTLEGHGGGFLYYMPVALLLLLPYTGLFLSCLRSLGSVRRDPLTAFLWIWFFFVLVFFSLSGTKLPHYLIYGISPLFILMAIHREALQSRWLAFLPPLLFFAFALLLPELLQLAVPRIKKPYFQEMLSQDIFGASYYLGMSLLSIAALAVALFVRRPIWQRLAAIGFVTTVAITGLLIPSVAQLQQGPVKEAALLAAKIGGPVTSYRITMPSFSVYRNAVTLPHSPPGYGELIFTRIDRLHELGNVDVLYHKGGIVLARRKS